MENLELHARLRDLDLSLGDQARSLVVGHWSIRIEGLDAGLAGRLDRRWGAFCKPSVPDPRSTLRVFRGGPGGWLERWAPGEHYRLEALNDPAHRLVASYHFALSSESATGRWRVGITDDPEEPLERIVDNTLRFVTADLALREGGFALHAAGVLRDGRAFLFAGPSGAGKTTVVRLVQPARSLGDDFAIVLPCPSGWVSPALPFDNSERIRHRPPEGCFPVAGIWRLRQAAETRVERLPQGLSVASLMACTAFPWAMPELADRLLEQVKRFVSGDGFRELHFTEDAELWRHFIQNSPTPFDNPG